VIKKIITKIQYLENGFKVHQNQRLIIKVEIGLKMTKEKLLTNQTLLLKKKMMAPKTNQLMMDPKTMALKTNQLMMAPKTKILTRNLKRKDLKKMRVVSGLKRMTNQKLMKTKLSFLLELVKS
jgi:hypothetical protein